jgi:hypothetical protein
MPVVGLGKVVLEGVVHGSRKQRIRIPVNLADKGDIGIEIDAWLSAPRTCGYQGNIGVYDVIEAQKEEKMWFKVTRARPDWRD